MRRVLLPLLGSVLIALATGLCAGAHAADSPACTAVKNQVTMYQTLITRLNKQLPNKDASIQKTRARQIKNKLEKDQAALVKAQVAVKAACGPSVVDYAGKYSGTFGAIEIKFSVNSSGILSGDILSALSRAIDPKSGTVDAKANFLGADCGVFKVAFDATAGTATATMTCTVSGLKQTNQVVARRH